MDIVAMLISDVKKAKSLRELGFKILKWFVIIGLLWVMVTVLQVKLSIGQ